MNRPPNPNGTVHQNQESKTLKYYCAYCKDVEPAEHHFTVEQVYVHWQKAHENSKNESSPKPFHFIINQTNKPRSYIVKLTEKMLDNIAWNQSGPKKHT